MDRKEIESAIQSGAKVFVGSPQVVPQKESKNLSGLYIFLAIIFFTIVIIVLSLYRTTKTPETTQKNQISSHTIKKIDKYILLVGCKDKKILIPLKSPLKSYDYRLNFPYSDVLIDESKVKTIKADDYLLLEIDKFMTKEKQFVIEVFVEYLHD